MAQSRPDGSLAVITQAALLQAKGLRMLGYEDPKRSLDYVTLGLFSHAVLRELRRIEQSGGEQAGDPRIMQNAIAAFLDAADAPLPTDTDLGGLVFDTYGTRSTLQEVLCDPTHEIQTIGSVSDALDVLRKATDPQSRLGPAQVLIPLFRKLAEVALVKTQFPSEIIPPGVQELATHQPGA